MLSSSSLFFVVTGIQFWISDYMRIILKQDQQTVFLSYSITSLTAPVIGVLMGGHILDRYGGYSGPNALNICLIFGIMASVSGIPMPFFSNFNIVIGLLWFLLLFGGALMPAVMGIMISSIPKYLRSFGNSNAQLIQNLLGYFPSPFVYGLVCNLTGGEESRAGMILLMFWSLWGVLGLSIGKKFFAVHLQKTAADNKILIEMTDDKNLLFKPSFMNFRDKNTAEIYSRLLNKEAISLPKIQEPSHNKFSPDSYEIKPLEQGISLRVYESLYGDQAKGRVSVLEMENAISPFNAKNTFKVNLMNTEGFITNNNFLFGTEKGDLQSGMLQAGKEKRQSGMHVRQTSLFGGIGNMFGKASMLIENDSDEEEEDERNIH